jgi:hypothetical protein
MEELVDEALANTFPASDPPFFMGSTAVVGTPHGKPSASERAGHAPASKDEPDRRPAQPRKTRARR